MSEHHCAGCLYAEFRHMPGKVYCEKWCKYKRVKENNHEA